MLRVVRTDRQDQAARLPAGDGTLVRPGTLCKPAPVGSAQRLCLGRRGLPAGADGGRCGLHARHRRCHARGRKGLVGSNVGVRESAQSRGELLVDLKARGLSTSTGQLTATALLRQSLRERLQQGIKQASQTKGGTMFRITVPALAIALLISGGVATAQQGELSAADKRAIETSCGPELKKYCRSYVSGDESLKSAIKACLKQHVREFSRSCKRALIAAKLHEG